MGTSIHTFVPQMRAARYFSIQSDNIASEIARLSTGERMLRANDNAASIAIAGGIRARVISYNQAMRNAQDAQSLMQTADGALDETGKILRRIRELVIRGASDEHTIADRDKIAGEIRSLVEDIDHIAERTHFNNIKLLAGGDAATIGFTFAVDLDVKDAVNVKIGTATAAALGVLTSQLSVDNNANAQVALRNLDDAIEKVVAIRSKLGTGHQVMEHAISTLRVTSNAAAEARSTITELDTARESVRLARDRIMAASSRAMFVAANQAATDVLDLFL